MARKYYPIWEQIKKTGSCTVSVHPKLHARIKKAVSKEKYGDLVFKMEWDLRGCQPELHISTVPEQPTVLVFKLIKPLTIDDL